MALAIALLLVSCASETLVSSDELLQHVDDTASPTEPAAATEPTAMPEPSATPEPTPAVATEQTPESVATPVPAQEPTPDSQLAQWEDIIAVEPYTSTDLVVSGEPTWQPTQNGVSARSFERTDDGVIVDGEFVRSYPVGAMTSVLSFDLDPGSGYGYGINEGVAEPGDGGCFEQLTNDDGSWTRSSFDAALGDFIFDPNAPNLFSLIDSPDEERFAVWLWDLVGQVPTIEELAGGWTRQFAVLDTDRATKAAEELGSTRLWFDAGYLEIIGDPNGATRAITLWVTALGDERTNADGATAIESTTFYTHSVIGPFQEPDRRVTAQTSSQESGCTSSIADISGSWNLMSLIGGGTEVPAAALDQMSGASVMFDADGSTVSGTTGCQDFTGTLTIDFDVVRVGEISLIGTPCVPGDFNQDELEALFLNAVTDPQRALIDLEDRLFLIVDVDGDQVIAAFRRS